MKQVGLERAPLQLLQRVIAMAFGFSVERLSARQWRVIEEGEEIHLFDEHDSIRVPEPMRHLVKVGRFG